MANNDGWLKQELDELDEAEQMIFDAISTFEPANGSKAPALTNKTEKTNESSSKVSNSQPISESSRSVAQLLSSLDIKSEKSDSRSDLDLPPPPDLDDLIISQPLSQTKTTEEVLPLPPVLLQSQKNKDPKMSSTKPNPPPVLPKPKKNVSTVQIQLNKFNDSTPKSAPKSAPKPALKPVTLVAPLDGSKAPVVSPKPSVPKPSVPKPKDSQIPPLVHDNDEAEKTLTELENDLEFYTKTLLGNVSNPKDEEFYGYCNKCNGVVEGEEVGCKAFDKIFHISCFNCETCKKSVHGIQFYAVNQKTFCEECYLATLEKCYLCMELITDKLLRASGRTYHPLCFKCNVCMKSLDGVPFTVDDDDVIYCVDDYYLKYASRCSVCGDPILPDEGKEEAVRIVAMEKDFHIGCYKCVKCGIQLSSEKEGKGCYPLDGEILCLNCHTTAKN